MEDLQSTSTKSAEKQIDLQNLIKILWNNKKYLLKYLLFGLVIGLIIAFSIPKKYSTTVVFTPETNSKQSSGIGMLASFSGINIGSGSSDVISPELYPLVLQSTPFLEGLFDIKIKYNDQDTTLYSYLLNDYKEPWWNDVLALPVKALSIFRRSNEVVEPLNDNEGIISLTQDERSVLELLGKSLAINVDKKTDVITLNVSLQDKYITAVLADTVSQYLQDYIISYRTSKARQDLDYIQKLFEKSKLDYYNIQKTYAQYVDENKNIISARFATTKDRLFNEMNLSYNLYNQMSQKLQEAQIKVQDTTPIYIIVQPPVEPIYPTSPNKKMIILGVMLFSTFIGVILLLYKERKAI